MLRIEILPAGHGDCIWIEYGHPDSPRRILLDGGATGTYNRCLLPKLAARPNNKEVEFELLVVTHVDGDHITGILDLLADKEIAFRAKDIWFNGYQHLPDEMPASLGPVQGEKLTDYLVKPNISWNAAFEGKAVVVPQNGDLPRKKLDGNLSLTLLSPTVENLAELKPRWEEEVVKAGLDPHAPRPEELGASEGFDLLETSLPDVEDLGSRPFSEDDSEANGSSIALLLDYENYRVLLAGDAHPSVLKDNIDRMRHGKQVKLTACKLPHHGSKANTNRQFLETLDCRTYVFSTNGAYFKHPDQEAVARVIKWGGPNVELVFNYRSKFNTVWENRTLRDEYGFSVSFPKKGSEGTILNFE